MREGWAYHVSRWPLLVRSDTRFAFPRNLFKLSLVPYGMKIGLHILPHFRPISRLFSRASMGEFY